MLTSCGHRAGPPVLAPWLAEAHAQSHFPHHTPTMKAGGPTVKPHKQIFLLSQLHLPPPPTGTQGSDGLALPSGLWALTRPPQALAQPLAHLGSLGLFPGFTSVPQLPVSDIPAQKPEPGLLSPTTSWHWWGPTGSRWGLQDCPLTPLIKMSPRYLFSLPSARTSPIPET